MKWLEERDALIAQTMAFVQSVSANRGDASRFDFRSRVPNATPPLATPPQVDPAPAPPAVEPPPPAASMRIVDIPALPRDVPLSRPFNRVDVQTEIRARIASFRAHQERFNRERHEYFSATLARLRAQIEELPPPPSAEK